MLFGGGRGGRGGRGIGADSLRCTWPWAPIARGEAEGEEARRDEPPEGVLLRGLEGVVLRDTRTEHACGDPLRGELMAELHREVRGEVRGDAIMLQLFGVGVLRVLPGRGPERRVKLWLSTWASVMSSLASSSVAHATNAVARGEG